MVTKKFLITKFDCIDFLENKDNVQVLTCPKKLLSILSGPMDFVTGRGINVFSP